MKGNFTFSSLILFQVFLLAIVMTSCAGESLTVFDTSKNGINYEYNEEKYEVTATGYYVNEGELRKNLEIPAEITSGKYVFKVVAIADKAFIGGPWESVILGSNIRTIGREAFEKCDAIKTIRIDGNTPPSLQKNAFESSVYETATLVVNSGLNLEGTNWDNFINVSRL